ncbi:MAG: TetR/AcrR family transcriptional regulator [Paracoccaceae bacterium]
MGEATHPNRPRLHRTDWVLAGFRALVAGGPEAIRVEPIARDLGATKGSFYWHFKDLRELRQTMLDAWEALASTEITAAVRRSGLGPRDRVMLLADRVSALPEAEAGGLAVEPALRDWGRTDPMARSVLERVDAQRLADLGDFLGAAGLDRDAAAEGALRFYAAVIGLENLRITCGIDMRAPLRAVARAILEGLA